MPDQTPDRPLYRLQTMPGTAKRVETGPLQFGDDWPGVFIRGDNAAAYAMNLQLLLESEAFKDTLSLDVFAMTTLRGLLALLGSCDVRTIRKEETNATD